jgi:hypothetical protein
MRSECGDERGIGRFLVQESLNVEFAVVFNSSFQIGFDTDNLIDAAV